MPDVDLIAIFWLSRYRWPMLHVHVTPGDFLDEIMRGSPVQRLQRVCASSRLPGTIVRGFFLLPVGVEMGLMVVLKLGTEDVWGCWWSPPNLAFGSTQLGPSWLVSDYALSIDASHVLVEQTEDGQYTIAVEVTLSQGLVTCAVRVVVHEKIRVREYEFQIKLFVLTFWAVWVKHKWYITASKTKTGLRQQREDESRHIR
jgi:hypothetical protein